MSQGRRAKADVHRVKVAALPDGALLQVGAVDGHIDASSKVADEQSAERRRLDFDVLEKLDPLHAELREVGHRFQHRDKVGRAKHDVPGKTEGAYPLGDARQKVDKVHKHSPVQCQKVGIGITNHLCNAPYVSVVFEDDMRLEFWTDGLDAVVPRLAHQ